MYVTVYWYVITDAQGTKCAAFTEDPSDTIQLSGMRKGGEHTHFEDDAMYAINWAERSGFKYENGEIKLYLPID